MCSLRAELWGAAFHLSTGSVTMPPGNVPPGNGRGTTEMSEEQNQTTHDYVCPSDKYLIPKHSYLVQVIILHRIHWC